MVNFSLSVMGFITLIWGARHMAITAVKFLVPTTRIPVSKPDYRRLCPSSYPQMVNIGAADVMAEWALTHGWMQRDSAEGSPHLDQMPLDRATGFRPAAF